MKSTTRTFKALPVVILFLVFAFIGQAAAQSWTQLAPAGGPPVARTLHTAVYDQTNNRKIVFGGFKGTISCPPDCLNDVWVLANADGLGGTPTWTQLSPSGTPPSPRGFHAAVYDSANNRMIVYAGDPNIGFCFGAVNDVWVLTNANGLGGTPTWTQLSPTGGPPPLRQGPKAVYDSANNRMIVFGGNANACVAGGSDVWVLSNANGLGGTPTWTQLSPTGGPPSPRFGHTTVYDPATNKMTAFGGLTNSGFANDVWVLANANGLGGTPTWTQLSPTGGPPSTRASHTAVLNTATNRMTIYAGNGSNGFPLGDVWVLTDATGISIVPFAAFTAKVEITLGPLANDDAFEVKANFTLGAGSNGLDIPTEIVSLQLTGGTGAFSTTIPAGSFVFVPAKPGKPAHFKFEGVIGGVALQAKITPLGGNSFEFKAEGQGAQTLTGMGNPVTVKLTIGDDGGSTTVTAEFE